MSLIQVIRELFLGADGQHEDGHVGAPSAPDLGDKCADWRQGDVFRDARTFVFDHEWSPLEIETPYGVAVVSQSCDASRPNRERIQIAPVVRLEDASDLREAQLGKRPQYVGLPRLGDDYFADLDCITTVMKVALMSAQRVSGVVSDNEVREFAFSVSRRFGRFAYPDDVVRCLEALIDALRSRARKEASPIGKVLKDVQSFRIHCEDWTTEPYQLTLIVILEPGVIPIDLDEIDVCPDDLSVLREKDLAERINALAVYLNGDGRNGTHRHYGWQYLAEAWAEKCEEAAKSRSLTHVVGSVSAEVASVDDFALSRYLVSESLDLDYLSESRKAPE